MKDIKLIIKALLLILIVIAHIPIWTTVWGAWEDNVICGKITYMNKGVDVGKYQLNTDYEMIIEFEKGYGQRAMDVGFMTWSQHKVGDRICYDLPHERLQTLRGMIFLVIFWVEVIVLIILILVGLSYFFQWLFKD